MNKEQTKKDIATIIAEKREKSQELAKKINELIMQYTRTNRETKALEGVMSLLEEEEDIDDLDAHLDDLLESEDNEENA